MRGRSYTPSPPRGYGRKERSPGPRGGRYGREDSPTSLLVRNLRHNCRAEVLRRPFSQFGPVKDIYLPRDYYSGGFGFVQFVDPDDAAEAKYQMDRQMFQGRELTVVFAKENRKKPTEMRARERGGSRDHVYDRRSPPPPPPRYSRYSRDYYSPAKRRYSRSVSPRDKKYNRERSLPLSPVQEFSPAYACPRSRMGTPVTDRSQYGSRSRSQSPAHGQSPVRARDPSRSRSRTPY